jgi:hypothetical protein
MFTIHGLKHGVGSMLDGNIQIRENLVPARHGINDTLVNMGGMQVKQTNPREFFDFAELLKQSAQIARARQILAVYRRILTDQHQFLDALSCQITGFGKQFASRPGTEIASDEWNGTIAAAIVTAFGNF